jgi:hypothetical protein
LFDEIIVHGRGRVFGYHASFALNYGRLFEPEWLAPQTEFELWLTASDLVQTGRDRG